MSTPIELGQQGPIVSDVSDVCDLLTGLKHPPGRDPNPTMLGVIFSVVGLCVAPLLIRAALKFTNPADVQRQEPVPISQPLGGQPWGGGGGQSGGGGIGPLLAP